MTAAEAAALADENAAAYDAWLDAQADPTLSDDHLFAE